MPIKTGSSALDALIGGGINEKLLTQVYGPAGSGKTNICLSTAYNAVKNNKTVLFIDTEGSFNQTRLEQICGKETQHVLENTILYTISSFEQQGKTVREITNSKKKIDFIIIDSFTALYRLEKNDETYQEANRELGKQIALLLNYAQKNEIPILLTNQVYTNIDTDKTEPVGGDILKYGTKIILELKHANNGYRQAILKRHAFKKENQSMEFEIAEKGLKDAA